MSTNLGTFSFQYGAEDPIETNIVSGETVLSAWKRVAPDLDADPSRPVTFRAGGVLLSQDSTPTAGQTIVATVTHEQKG